LRPGQEGDQGQDRQLLAQDIRLNGDRADQGRQAQDQGDIGNIGAVGVAQRNCRAPLQGGECGDRHLRHRGAETDDHHADQQGRHAKVAGDRSRPADKPVGAPHQQDQTNPDCNQ